MNKADFVAIFFQDRNLTVKKCNTKPCAEDKVCPDSHFDVAIVIEANAKTGNYEEKIKKFLLSIISSYKSVSPGDARICLVRFSSWSETISPFDQDQDINSISIQINNLGFYGKGADLQDAIETMVTECFDENNGWRGTSLTSNGVASQAIFLTHSDITDIKSKGQIILKIYQNLAST